MQFIKVHSHLFSAFRRNLDLWGWNSSFPFNCSESCLSFEEYRTKYLHQKYSFNDRIVNGQFHKYFSVGVDRFSQFNYWMRLISWEFILTFHYYWKMHFFLFRCGMENEECLIIIRQTVTVNYNMCIVDVHFLGYLIGFRRS